MLATAAVVVEREYKQVNCMAIGQTVHGRACLNYVYNYIENK